MAGSVQLPQYPEFSCLDDGGTATRWADWLDGFQAMLKAMKVDEDDHRRALLLHYAGSDVRKLFKKLANTGEEGDYTSAVSALTTYFSPPMNRVYLMNTLQKLKQQPDESMDNYHMRVREKLTLLNMDEMTVPELVELITLAQLVNNCTSNNLRTKALKGGMKLTDFLDTARAHETAERQANEIRGEQSTVHQVTTKSRGRQYGKNRKWNRSNSRHTENAPTQRPKSQSRRKCYFCGGDYPHATKCPAEGKICEGCNKKGHFVKVCRSRQVKQLDMNQKYDDDTAYLGAITLKDNVNSMSISTEISVNKHVFSVLVDSGAQANLMSARTFGEIEDAEKFLKPTKNRLYPYHSTDPLPVKGTIRVRVISKTTDKETITEFFVLEGEGQNLLSCQTSVDLGLIKTMCQVNTQSLEQILKENKDRFEGMGKMKDASVKLHIDHEIEPVQQPVRRVPYHLRAQVEEEIERLEKLDIIEKAEGPTTWVSPVVIVPKSEDAVRLCVDSRAINKAIKRERHPIPTIEDLITDLNGCKIFSKIDLNKGYHQLELDTESRHITTFVTHQGLYRYKRLCFGLNSAAEVFQKRISQMLAGLSGVMNISDDIIIYSKESEEHRMKIREVFERMKEYNVTANQAKCEFEKPEITFFGHKFSGDGITASEEKVQDIKQMQEPRNASEVRSFLGMAQYLARFIPNYTNLVVPLRKLTHQDVEWRWGRREQLAFQEVKDSLSSCETMSYYDMKLPIEVIVDASPVGLGALLTQKSGDEVKIVAYASRGLTNTEQRYSQTEREMLGVVWACERFQTYLRGTDFVVITDHKSLESVVNGNKSTTARLERLRLRLQPYHLMVRYRAGADNPADFLSRHPTNNPQPQETTALDQQVEGMCIGALKMYRGITIEELREKTREDSSMKELAKAIVKDEWTESVGQYKKIKDELSVGHGLILRQHRIVIPEALRNRVIEIAHQAHQGIVKTKALLRESVWFPGIDSMVEQAIRECIPCQAATPKTTKSLEPLRMTKLPGGPWESVSADFSGPFNGQYLLVVIDDYSRYPEVELISALTSETVIPHFDAIFARQGIPLTLRTDNGPPFNGKKFTHWIEDVLGSSHRKITPLWPRANGEVERFMRTLDKFIRATLVERGSWKQELYRFLRQYRATPHSTTGKTPSELLNARKLRTEIPSVRKTVRFQDDEEILRRRDERLKQHMKELADTTNHARPLDVNVGDSVLLPKRREVKTDPPFNPLPYKVTEAKGTMVTMERDGHRVTRNSSQVKKVQDSETVDTPSVLPEDETMTMDTPSVEQTSSVRRSTRERAIPSKYDDFIMQ